MRKILFTLFLSATVSSALALEISYTGTLDKADLNTGLSLSSYASSSVSLQASNTHQDPYDPYYDEYDDFRYSRRLRRFNSVGVAGDGFGYYDPYYTNDVYYVIGSPLWDRWYAPRRVFVRGGFVKR